MKRGLIVWDKTELSPAVFAQRLERVQSVLAAQELGALAVYSDLWRSNHGRFLANYMPYFNRALLLVPREGKPLLLCGLSPRVYGWIKSVTPIEDVRPAGNFARTLQDIGAERRWSRIGLLDAPQMPYDLLHAIRSSALEWVSVDAKDAIGVDEDVSGLTMRRKAASMARRALGEESSKGTGKLDYEFVGILEGRLRKGGAEDLAILISNGSAAPAPACGNPLSEGFSVSLAVEYRGHWARVTRPSRAVENCEKAFTSHLERYPLAGVVEDLSGAYPWECGEGGNTAAIHIEVAAGGRRLFYGDTCRRGARGWEVL